MHRPLLPAVLLFLATSLLDRAETARPDYPATKTSPVSDTYFGTKVADPYRWLENPDDPAVKAWAAAQTKLALDLIQGSPDFAALKKRVAELDQTSPVRFGLTIRGKHLFYQRETPPEAQADLMTLDQLGGTERVLFDPAAAAVKGVQPSIETVEVAPDGSKVAFTTQFGGSEDETVHVVDAASGKMLADSIPHAGGGTSPVALAWDGDGKGFLHTLWPKKADGTYATSGILIYHHVLGTEPASDTYVFGRGMSPRSEYHLATSLSGETQALVTTDGDGVHASVYLRRGSAPFTLVATPDAAIAGAANLGGAFVGEDFYVMSKKRDSRGEIVALKPGGTFATAKVIVPATSVVIQDIVPIAGGFITEDIDGGDSSARMFDPSGKVRFQMPIPKVSRAAIAGDPNGGPIVIRYGNYTTDLTWLAYDASTNGTRKVSFPSKVNGDFSPVVVERVFVPSLDGKVKIPLEIVHLKSMKRDGSAPTILTAYGAYGVISTPFFDPTILAWLERGGVFAQAMIRGGGEYGDAWHKAARLATKTVSSDDVAACAKWLGKNGYGNHNHLGIEGGSAGGFLMGLALTRNPELYRAVVSDVGIYDLLRVELTPNGAFNTPEFGTVKDATQFPWMLKQSPYHNVRAGTKYPAILMMTGENDPRVDPFNSRKMIAVLQADTGSNRPVLLIERAGEGHGIGNSFDQYVEAQTDRFAFFLGQLK